jgi:branched-chain amino acid transport system permease protein
MDGVIEQTTSAARPASAARALLGEIGPGLAVAVFVAVLLPVFASAYWLNTLTAACVMSLASLSVAVLYAQLGMVSLCQYALVGVGGWFTLRIWHGTHPPFEVALLGGGVAAAVFGLIAGLPALRMRGLYLALITLMIAGAAQIVISAIGFPDGGPGVTGRVVNGARVFMNRPLLATSDAAYFRYVVIALTIGFFLVRRHRLSRAGRAWAQIRRSEVCALAGGVNITAYKVWAFTLAGFLAGIAGGLQADVVGQLDGSAFPASSSILLFALTVIAGAFHWLGPLIAGLLLRAVPALLSDWHVDGNIATIIFGAGLLHALMTAPEGVSGQLLGLGQKIAAAFRLRRAGGTS